MPPALWGQERVYLADTAFVTDTGAGGAPASALFEPGGTYYGYDMKHTEGKAMADAIIVPAGAIWRFDTVILYAYQITTGASSPITAVYLSIYKDGPPGTGTLLWGDTVTNRMVATGFTGIYRVWPNDPAGKKPGAKNPILYTNRPIMYTKLFLSPAPILSAGEYWLVWSADGNKEHTGPWCPVKVLPGRKNPPDQKAMRKVDGKWSSIVEGAGHIGFNIIIKAGPGLGSVDSTAAMALYQNQPNPCGEQTTILFSLRDPGVSSFIFYNEFGAQQATFDNGYLGAGEHTVTIKTLGFPAGNYKYELRTEHGSMSKSMTVQ